MLEYGEFEGEIRGTATSITATFGRLVVVYSCVGRGYVVIPRRRPFAAGGAFGTQTSAVGRAYIFHLRYDATHPKTHALPPALPNTP